MNKLVRLLPLLTASQCVWAGTIVLNWDDIDTGGYVAQVPTNYHGFTFDGNWYALNESYYNSSYSNAVTFPSGPNAAYNNFGLSTVTLASTSAYKLTSLDAAWWAADGVFTTGFSSTTLTIEAFMNGTPVGSDQLDLATDFSLFHVSLPAANSWDFINSSGAAWWLVDDLSFASTTPEPASVILTAIAALALVALRRLTTNQ